METHTYRFRVCEDVGRIYDLFLPFHALCCVYYRHEFWFVESTHIHYNTVFIVIMAQHIHPNNI